MVAKELIEMTSPDFGLLVEVERYSTGQNAHQIAQTATVYLSGLSLAKSLACQSNPVKHPNDFAEAERWLRHAREAETTLRRFVHTSRLKLVA